MKITIDADKSIKETEIHIKCSQMDERLEELISGLCLLDSTFVGYMENEAFFIPLAEIIYFEAVEGKIFFYTSDKCYRAVTKLYKIEEIIKNSYFARISKTVIANLKKMISIKKADNARLVATMISGEKLIVSRQYVSEIKKKLGV